MSRESDGALDFVKSLEFPSLAMAVRSTYKAGEEDERLNPIVVLDVNNEPKGRIDHEDVVIFYDIRGEREIEITKALTDKDFSEFSAKKMDLDFVTMIRYHDDLNVRVAYPPNEDIKDTLCHVLSQNMIPFFKIVESEKGQHLTYFFNGKSRKEIPYEERLIIPSRNVSRPQDDPQMQISAVTDAVVRKIEDERARVIIANLANVDVVGHTEDEEAIIKAIRAVDGSLKRITDTEERNKVTTIVTADHGTVEKWLYPDGTKDTGHTDSLVPFVLLEPDGKRKSDIILRKEGELSDVAPTVLEILGLKKPAVMSGSSLLAKNPYKKDPKNRILLLILDGWGVNDEQEGNLFFKAKPSYFTKLLRKHPSARLKASQEAVGMPKGSVGNSEVGHLHIGSGRRILSDRLRIDEAVDNGSFFKNEAFLWAMNQSKKKDRPLHLLGIVSFYSSHGSLAHLKALLEMAKKNKVKKVFIHSILGRRGEKKDSGANYIGEIEDFTKKLNLGEVVAVMGRHWILDREENWDRIQIAYRCLVYGDGVRVKIQEGD